MSVNRTRLQVRGFVDLFRVLVQLPSVGLALFVCSQMDDCSVQTGSSYFDMNWAGCMMFAVLVCNQLQNVKGHRNENNRCLTTIDYYTVAGLIVIAGYIGVSNNHYMLEVAGGSHFVENVLAVGSERLIASNFC